MSSPLTDYWKLLDSLEDYLRYGIRRPHPEMPPLERRPGTVTSGVPDPAGSGSPARAGSAGSAEVPVRAAAGEGDSLDRILRQISGCTLCGLHAGRHSTVPGEGSSSPLVMVIGEGPGADEDRTGRPFVGRAGQYLDKWLAAIGLSRETNCYIGNIVKCRPPENRDPHPEEAEACLPYLIRQIDCLKPRFILSVGRIAGQILTGRQEGIGRIRGQVYSYRGIPVVPTYHPSGVLRNEEEYKPRVWEDLKLLRRLMEEKGR